MPKQKYLFDQERDRSITIHLAPAQFASFIIIDFGW